MSEPSSSTAEIVGRTLSPFGLFVFQLALSFVVTITVKDTAAAEKHEVAIFADLDSLSVSKYSRAADNLYFMRKKRRSTRLVPASKTELEEFKAFLGPLAKDYTDGELRQLRQEMYAMGDILLDLHIAKNKTRELPSIEF